MDRNDAEQLCSALHNIRRQVENLSETTADQAEDLGSLVRWQAHSLESIAESLQGLVRYAGDCAEALAALVAATKVVSAGESER